MTGASMGTVKLCAQARRNVPPVASPAARAERTADAAASIARLASARAARPASAATRPGNIWVGDEGARAAVEQLSRDIGMQAFNGGPLSRAATQEDFGYILNSIAGDAGGLVFYRFATPRDFSPGRSTALKTRYQAS
jgi:hypothetical protein